MDPESKPGVISKNPLQRKNSRRLASVWHRKLLKLIIVAVLVVTCFTIRTVFDWGPEQTSRVFESKSPNSSLLSTTTSSHSQNGEQNSHTLDYVLEKFLIRPAPPYLPLNLTKPVTTTNAALKVLKLLQQKRNGFFVEAGAHDGEYLSNTLALEANYSWEGLLVEPNSAVVPTLKSRNRKAWIAPVCLSPSNYIEQIKMRRPRNKNLAVISNIKKYSYHFSDDNFVYFNVTCVPLFALLRAIGRTEVDYLSLDVEGAELPILKTIPFDKVKIRVLGVEDSGREMTREAVRSLLQSKGYVDLGVIHGLHLHDNFFYLKE